jgi:AraC-like DNA-binding protein
LRFLSLYLHLHDRGSVPYVWTDRHLGMFGYTLNCPEIIGSDHIYDGAMAIACNMLRELAGPTWRAKEVRLFRDAPADLAPFRKHFRAPLRFRAEQAAIVFPAADLKRPCVGADADSFARALSDLESLDAESGATLADKVHRVLLSLFVTGVNCGGATADRAMIARLFALHPRTLNRRLRAEGTNFAAVLTRARFDIARELLRDTRLPVHDIALLLGYAGTGPFTHAFRRWSGTTAARWRESCRPVQAEVPSGSGHAR